MTLVVNASLDAVADVDTETSFLVLELFVETCVFLEDISHEISVFRKVGALIGHAAGQESGTFLWTVVLSVTTS